MVTVLPLEIVKIRPVALPSRRMLFDVGPVIVRCLVIASSPLVSVIVSGPAPAMLNVMLSLAHASATAWRKEPAPASAVVVTTGLIGHAETSCDVVPEL